MNTRRQFLLKSLGAACSGLAVAGCATGPTVDPQTFGPLRGVQSRLVFYFDRASFLAHGIKRRLLIDEISYGEIDVGEFMVLDMAPGMRRITLQVAHPIFGGTGDQSFPVDLHVGQVVYGRVFQTSTGSYYGSVSPQLALAQMRGMTRVPSSPSFNEKKSPQEIGKQNPNATSSMPPAATPRSLSLSFGAPSAPA